MPHSHHIALIAYSLVNLSDGIRWVFMIKWMQLNEIFNQRDDKFVQTQKSGKIRNKHLANLVKAKNNYIYINIYS